MFVLGNGLVPSVLDSQSLGAGFDAQTEVYLSILFLPHLCQQGNYYHFKIFINSSRNCKYQWKYSDCAHRSSLYVCISTFVSEELKQQGACRE